MSLSAEENNTIVLENYSKIVTTGNVHLLLMQSDGESSITTELYGITKFRYKVKNGVLYIDVPTGIFAPRGYLKIVASTPHLTSVEVQGAAVECLTEISGDIFNFKTEGSVNTANLWVDVDNLTLDVDGRSDILARGVADNASLSAVLGSRIDIIGLSVEDLNVKAYEASEIYAMCDGTISAKLSTDATLYWTGDARMYKKEVLGGRVMRIYRGEVPYLFDKYDDVEVYTSFSAVAPNASDNSKSSEQSIQKTKPAPKSNTNRTSSSQPKSGSSEDFF